MEKNKLSTQPYKGARDFYPKDMRIRNYIFDIWKDVCKSYGYEEYDGPFVEPFELYAAKTGDEIVNKQMYSFEDRGGRKLAIRPEMTPTLARMVAAKYKELTFPLKWFSIPNCWRYEKPQRGRAREFYQLNIDIFGVDSPKADFEIISMAVEMMKRAGAKEGMFEIRINNRKLMSDIYERVGIENKEKTYKIIDKKRKMPSKEFSKLLNNKELEGLLNNPEKILSEFSETEGAREIKTILDLAKENEIEGFIKYDPTTVRGLDYYTGIVFEQFDLNPNNNRSMCGGGRYDNLVTEFINEKIPATGFAVGDVTLKNFLETWDLLPEINGSTEYLETILNTEPSIAPKVRSKGKSIETWLTPNTKLDKQLKYADRKGIRYAIIRGDDEITSGTATIKDLEKNVQETKPLEDFLSEIS